jgi:hypothetical protein
MGHESGHQIAAGWMHLAPFAAIVLALIGLHFLTPDKADGKKS